VLGFSPRWGCRGGSHRVVLLFGSRGLQNAIAEGDTRTISLHHIHTDEDITITFKRDGRYDEAALEKLNWFLRDWRKRGQETRMDPHLIDLVWEVQREAGSKEPIWVVCGYRSPETNAMLRRRSGASRASASTCSATPWISTFRACRSSSFAPSACACSAAASASIRPPGRRSCTWIPAAYGMWPRMTREQLVRVFPDGRTVTFPTDGRPLPGYALALADIRNRGKAKLAQVASNAEDKFAAEKTKLIKIVSKARVITRAEAATATPNEVIETRGFWQGIPQGEAIRSVAVAAARSVAALASPTPAAEVASSDPETTESIPPFSAAHQDHTAPEGVLAYAESPDGDAPAAGGAAAAPRATVTGPVAVRAGADEMTIAVKRVTGRPTSAILTVCIPSACR
jgi:hypothetical protein